MTLSHTGAESHEIRGLTGIRGFAAVLVVVFHYFGGWVLLFPALAVFGVPASHGYLGVDLFFILSGFILCYVYNVAHKKLTLPEYGQFLLFRLARIYPNHLAMLLLLVFLVLVAPLFRLKFTGFYAFDDLPFQLTLTHSWPINPRMGQGNWNFPAWSISAEWFAYLVIFPVVAFLLQRIRRPALALFLGSAALLFWPLYDVMLPSHPQQTAYYGLVHVSAEFFAGGMYFSVFVLGSGLVRFCQRWLFGLFSTLFVLFLFPESSWEKIGILFIFPLLLLGLTSEVSLPARLLSTPSALWLGRVSYALYMSHGVAQKFIKILLPATRYVHASMAVRILVVFSHLLIILMLTVCLYYLVEIPARNYLRKIWSSGSAARGGSVRLR